MKPDRTAIMVQPDTQSGANSKFMANCSYLDILTIELLTEHRNLEGNDFILTFVMPSEISGIPDMWVRAFCKLCTTDVLSPEVVKLVFRVHSYECINDD